MLHGHTIILFHRYECTYHNIWSIEKWKILVLVMHHIHFMACFVDVIIMNQIFIWFMRSEILNLNKSKLLYINTKVRNWVKLYPSLFILLYPFKSQLYHITSHLNFIFCNICSNDLIDLQIFFLQTMRFVHEKTNV